MESVVIDYKGATAFTLVGLSLPSKGLRLEEWLDVGTTIRQLERVKNFAIGDWIIAGESNFGDSYTNYIQEWEWGGYDKMTKLVWVARKVPPFQRNPNLTWTHHHHVASLGWDEQTFWLRQAEENQWSAADLKARIKDARTIEADDDVPFSGSGPENMGEASAAVVEYESELPVLSWPATGDVRQLVKAVLEEDWATAVDVASELQWILEVE